MNEFLMTEKEKALHHGVLFAIYVQTGNQAVMQEAENTVFIY